MFLVFLAVVVVVDFGLGKQPVAPNRLAVGGKRAVGIEGGFAFFDIAAGVHAVVDVAVFAEVVLAEEAVAPCPVFGFIVFVLQVCLIGDKASFAGDVARFPVGTDMVFALDAVTVDLFQACVDVVGQLPIARAFGAGEQVAAGADTDIEVGIGALFGEYFRPAHGKRGVVVAALGCVEYPAVGIGTVAVGIGLVFQLVVQRVVTENHMDFFLQGRQFQTTPYAGRHGKFVVRVPFGIEHDAQVGVGRVVGIGFAKPVVDAVGPFVQAFGNDFVAVVHPSVAVSGRFVVRGGKRREEGEQCE